MVLLPSKKDKVMRKMLNYYKNYDIQDFLITLEFCKTYRDVFLTTRSRETQLIAINGVSDICYKLGVAQLLPSILYLYLYDCSCILYPGFGEMHP